MLTFQENETLARVGPGTPTGQLMRRYWMPSTLSWELPDPDCPPIRVRLLGEDLIAFRDTNSRTPPGLGTNVYTLQPIEKVLPIETDWQNALSGELYDKVPYSTEYVPV